MSRLTAVFLLCLVFTLPAHTDSVHVLTVKGAISPASADYLMRVIKLAADEEKGHGVRFCLLPHPRVAIAVITLTRIHVPSYTEKFSCVKYRPNRNIVPSSMDLMIV